MLMRPVSVILCDVSLIIMYNLHIRRCCCILSHGIYLYSVYSAASSINMHMHCHGYTTTVKHFI